MNASALLYDPLVPWPLVWLAIALSFAAVGVALWRGLSGWWLRAAALAILSLALANPSLQIEEREELSDIVLLIVDESASQKIDLKGRIG